MTIATETPLVLSASSITTYLRCGRQWYYGYVAGIKRAPSIPQVVGIAGHKAVELNMAQKIHSRTDLPLGDVLDGFATSFDAQAPELEDSPKEVGKAKDSGVRAVTAYHRLAAPLIQPIEVERAVQFDIDGIHYSGQIDEIDDGLAVRDTKFLKRRPYDGAYKLNMTGYALSLRQAASTPSEPVVESDTVLDVILRTKEPQYVPISAGGPVSEAEIRRFANVVRSVHDGITAGSFPPNGLLSDGGPPACTWCGYRDLCPAYTAMYGRARSKLGGEEP